MLEATIKFKSNYFRSPNICKNKIKKPRKDRRTTIKSAIKVIYNLKLAEYSIIDIQPSYEFDDIE